MKNPIHISVTISIRRSSNFERTRTGCLFWLFVSSRIRGMDGLHGLCQKRNPIALRLLCAL